MANASYVQDSFTGGEKSQLAQGRITDKEYRTWMNVCVNGHPTEAGGWVRRAGTMYGSHTRGGAVGRVYKFDFAAATARTMEFTDNFIRFRSGTVLDTTNDAQAVVAISASNPAVVQTAGASGWPTGSTVMLGGLGAGMPRLQNRQFLITVVNSTHFSLTDPLTNTTIDGSVLGAFPGGSVTVSRVQEVASPYNAGKWQTLRAVQAETDAVLLQGSIAPQLLAVSTPVPASGSPQFSLTGLTFLDGPYFDPPTNGVQLVPNGHSGSIVLTAVFQQYSATQAYKLGDFVTSAAINYQSLIDNNVNNTPASSPTAWTAVSAGAAINNGQGFLGTDVGRLVRLLSAPALWSATATYSQNALVAYNPTQQPGAVTYWISLINSNTGIIPGTDINSWGLASQQVFTWTWGKITSLVTQIPQGAGSITATMANFSAAFDGNFAQPNASACSTNSFFFFNNVPPNFFTTLSIDAFIGKNFTGSPQVVELVTVYPATDFGFFNLSFGNVTGNQVGVTASGLHVNLRASQTLPSSASDGVLLSGTGTGQFANASASGPGGGTVDFGGAISLVSSDTVTAWNYVWVELTGFVVVQDFQGINATAVFTACVSEVQFFNPPGVGGGNAVNIEVLGPPLLYTFPVINWRLGVYSNTTGWPTVGTYHQGRIWLAGAVDNRFDGSVSNGLVGTSLNMAPTDYTGAVGASNGVAGIVNSDGVNPIFWLMPDLQGVLMGTKAGEWLISAPAGGAISATNIDAARVTRIGCAFVEPRKTDHTTVFVQRYTKKVMEYFTDVYSGKFAAPNLAKDTMHITKPKVAELAYTQANIPIVWGRNNDGSWWGATYKRDTLATATGPTINGWHRHSLGSGRSVQSIAAGPSVGGDLDALTLVTVDSATGVYHVEVMTDAVEEGETLVQAAYLDDAVNPTSTTTSNTSPAPYGGLTLNGLWHLNGKTVTAWLGGLDCGDYAVSNGSITVPYGDGISAGTASGLFTAQYAASLSLSQMLVGFTFTSQGQLVRPATPQESGARNGPAVGKVRRNHKFATHLEGTGVGVMFGTNFTDQLDPAEFRLLDDTPYAVNQQFTGVYKNTITDPHSLDGMICWQQTRPLPVNIANIAGFIETSDE